MKRVLREITEMVILTVVIYLTAGITMCFLKGVEFYFGG